MLITLAQGEECEGNVLFGSVCLSICMSVRARNAKPIAPIDLIVFYCSNGNLQALTDNIKYARTKTPQQLGIKVNRICS